MPSPAMNILAAISTLILMSYIAGYAMPAAIQGVRAAPSDSDALIARTAAYNTTDNYTWVVYNTSYAVGGQGYMMEGTISNSTPPHSTPVQAADPANTTAEDLFMQVMGPSGIGTNIMKAVLLLGVIGIICTVLMQTGFIPTFSHGRDEEQRGAYGGAAGGTYAGGLEIDQQDDPHQPAQSTPPPEQEEKKPEKRDRYEVIKV